MRPVASTCGVQIVPSASTIGESASHGSVGAVGQSPQATANNESARISRVRNMVRLLRVIVVVVVASVMALAGAQTFAKQEDGATAPVLAEVDVLRYKTHIQQMQIAQLQAQAAQRDFDAAKTAVLEMEHRLARPGYTLDWQRGVYVRANP